MDVHPSLTYRDIEVALSDLSEAFGLIVEVQERHYGQVRAATLSYGRGTIMVQPELPDDLHGEHAGHGWVYLVVDDPDQHHARATASGRVQVLNDPHGAFDDTQYGYSARDCEGNLWSFGTMRPPTLTQPAAAGVTRTHTGSAGTSL